MQLTMSHGIYLVNNESINHQLISIKNMFDNMVGESERFADSPFHALLVLNNSTHRYF